MNASRIEQLKSFLEQSPEDSFLMYALALEYVAMGEAQAAESMFQSLLRQNASYVATYYHYGKLLEKLNRPQEALNLYARGIAVAEQLQDEHSLRELREARFNLEVEI